MSTIALLWLQSFQRDVKSLGSKLLEHRSTATSLQREGVNLSPKSDCFLDQLDNRCALCRLLGLRYRDRKCAENYNK